MKRLCVAVMISIFALVALGCEDNPNNARTNQPQPKRDAKVFRVLASSENRFLKEAVEQLAKEKGFEVGIDFKGSVDIKNELLAETKDYDAVFVAHSIWARMGDPKGRIKELKSIYTTPVIPAVKVSVAKQLGFYGKQDFDIKEFLDAIQKNNLRYGMTNAARSNSGTMGLIGFVSALRGGSAVLSPQDLHDPALVERVRPLLAGMNRTSGSSDELNQAALNSEMSAYTMYEALIIENNRELEKQKREPFYALYPKGGVVLADCPFGFIDQGRAGKMEQFKQIQDYLLSPPMQEQLLRLGRRTGLGGTIPSSMTEVFRPEWGMDPKRQIAPIRIPQENVVEELLQLYLTDWKKPVYLVLVLDFSQSMATNGGEQQLKEGMELIFDPDKARRENLQPSKSDVIKVIIFASAPKKEFSASGGNQQSLQKLLTDVKDEVPDGGTDIYTPTIRALEILAGEPNLDQYIPEVVLMTDGESNTGKSFADLRNFWNQRQREWQDRKLIIPIFTIGFGDAKEAQLKEIADLAKARYFDGRKDLKAAFREVKGYN